jgi:hypothetical protein
MCLLNLDIEQDQEGRVATIRFSLLENKVQATSFVAVNAKDNTIDNAGIAKKIIIRNLNDD